MTTPLPGMSFDTGYRICIGVGAAVLVAAVAASNAGGIFLGLGLLFAGLGIATDCHKVSEYIPATVYHPAAERWIIAWVPSRLGGALLAAGVVLGLFGLALYAIGALRGP